MIFPVKVIPLTTNVSCMLHCGIMQGVAFIMDKYTGIRNEKVYIYCGYK